MGVQAKEGRWKRTLFAKWSGRSRLALHATMVGHWKEMDASGCWDLEKTEPKWISRMSWKN